MKDRNVLFSIVIIAVNLLLIALGWFNYDFSKGVYLGHYYDILVYAPKSLVAVAIIAVLFSIITLMSRERLLKIIAIYLVNIPFIFEVVVNHPNIWARDVYLHGQIWELDNVGRLEDISYLYPKQYPNFFMTLYTLYRLIGVGDIREANLLVFYPMLMVLYTTLLYVLSHQLLNDKDSRGIFMYLMVVISFLYVMNNRNELTFQHANTRLYSLILLYLLLYLYFILLKISRRSENVLISLFSLGLIFSHPLFSLFPVLLPLLLALNYIILNHAKTLLNNTYVISGRTISICLFVTFLWLSWHLYNYATLGMLATGVKSFLNYYYRLLGLELVTASVTVLEPIPWYFMILRNYYKFTLGALGLLALFALIRALLFSSRFTDSKNSLMKMHALLLLSFIEASVIVFGLTIFSASLGNSIDRGVMTLAPITVIIALGHLRNMTGDAKHLNLRNTLTVFGRNKFMRIFSSLLLVVLLISIFEAQYLLVHEEPVAVAFTQSLDNTCTYLNQYNSPRSQIVSMTPFAIYYSFFNPTNKIVYVVGDLGYVKNLDEVFAALSSYSGIKVITYRSIVYWSLRYSDPLTGWNEFYTVVLKNLSLENSLVYSNGIYESAFYG